MLLADKHAVIYGAAGAVGSAVARTFAREGATVHLTGRDSRRLGALASEIRAAGGSAETAVVDALDERAVESHLDAAATSAGGVDVSFNAIGIPQTGVQGIPLLELSPDAYTAPAATYLRAHFVTARAAGRRMAARGSGVILLHTPEPARVAAPLVGGMAPAWAAIEALSRGLSAELGPRGVRTVTMRSTGIPETATIDVVFGLHARTLGVTRAQFDGLVAGMTHRRRFTSLAELGDAAAFLASDRAAAMTGAVANLTGGIIAD
ncbi:MAG TPA: SDR family oxidoreductase [Gemmatimonadaceae bacterium]|nr:SDR family oxidoreductase [Gemmatimonadaceae bacterium]